jgi:phosphoserine aminotransferase
LVKNNMAIIPHPPYLPDLAPCDFSLFLRLKICHFGTIEVIEAEPQTVLNILTEHDFQDASKKWEKHWEWCIHLEWDYVRFVRNGTTSGVMVASGPKVI